MHRRNFLKRASTVLGALALCPAVLIARPSLPGGTVRFIYKDKEFTVQGNVSYSRYLERGLVIGNPRTFLKENLQLTFIK